MFLIPPNDKRNNPLINEILNIMLESCIAKNNYNYY